MLKQIAITGPESTGKTELAEKLAKHFHAPLISEYAREYITALNRKYNQEDVLEIAKQMISQRQLITNNTQLTTDFLFFDTELINIKIWLEFYGWEVPNWLTENIVKNPFALYLLMDIDVPWVADKQRANPNDRAFIFQKFEEELKTINANYVIISGLEQERFKNALKAINAHLF